MIRKTLVILVILMMAVTVLAACGGGDEEPTPEPTEAPAAAEPAEEVAEEEIAEEATAEPEEEHAEEATKEPEAEATEAPTEETAEAGDAVVLTVWADDTRAPALAELAPEFEAQYGVKLDVQELAFGDIRDQMKLAGPAGEGPDLFIGAHDWIGELYLNDLLAPVNLSAKESEFFDVALDLFTYEGGLVGLPYATENLAFFYNPDLISEVPADWQGVYDLSVQLQEEGATKFGFCRMSGDPFHFYPIQTGHGGYIFGKDTDGNWDVEDIGFGNEGSVESATWLDEMVKAGVIDGAMDWDTMHVLFETGDCAMTLTGPWALSRFREAGASYAIADFPAGPAGASAPFLGGQGFFINNFSENKLLAEAFLTEVIATEPAMRALFEADPRPSAYLAVREDSGDPDQDFFATAGEKAQPMPTIPEMSAVWGPAGDAIILIGNQAATPEEAMTNAAAQIQAAISGG